MTKRITTFHRVVVGWMIPGPERQKIESLLTELGYDVDGGGTDLVARSAEIRIRPKRRVRKPGPPKPVSAFAEAKDPAPAPQPRVDSSTPPPSATKRE